jgi:putative FmdB family regulatory protein
MPIYEYACQKCEHTFDALQKMHSDPLTECPECGEHALKKLVSAPNFRLKGSGWYETDFKTKNQRNLVDEPDKKSAKTDGDASKATGGDAKSDSGGKGAEKKAGESSTDKSAGSTEKPASGKSGTI